MDLSRKQGSLLAHDDILKFLNENGGNENKIETMTDIKTFMDSDDRYLEILKGVIEYIKSYGYSSKKLQLFVEDMLACTMDDRIEKCFTYLKSIRDCEESERFAFTLTEVVFANRLCALPHDPYLAFLITKYAENQDLWAWLNTSLAHNHDFKRSVTNFLMNKMNDNDRFDLYKLIGCMCDDPEFVRILLKDAIDRFSSFRISEPGDDDLVRAIVATVLTQHLPMEKGEVLEKMKFILAEIVNAFNECTSILQSPDHFKLAFRLALVDHEFSMKLHHIVSSFLSSSEPRTDTVSLSNCIFLISQSSIDSFDKYVRCLIEDVLNGKFPNTETTVCILEMVANVFISPSPSTTTPDTKDEDGEMDDEKRISFLNTINIEKLLFKCERTPFSEFRIALIHLIHALCASKQGMVLLKQTDFPLLEYLLNLQSENDNECRRKKIDLIRFVVTRAYCSSILGDNVTKKLQDALLYGVGKASQTYFNVANETAQ